MAEPPSPVRPADDEARALARGLLDKARTAALGVIEPASGAPYVSLVGFGMARDGCPVSLLSGLSAHTRALRANPRASLLLSDPGPRGDPLNHPRLTIMATATFVGHGSEDHRSLREDWLAGHPKARLYVDFSDFSFVRFSVVSAALNGGFGQAFSLAAQDLILPSGQGRDRHRRRPGPR